MNRIALALVAATIACGAPPARPRRPARAPAVPLARLDSRVTATIHLTPQDGVPRRVFVRAELVFDRDRGMDARIFTSGGVVEFVCDGRRAWTLYPQCAVESSCDDGVRRWFDIGWGYAELAQFVSGDVPRVPGWNVTHRRSLRGMAMPTSSLIASKDPSEFPFVDVGWQTEIPAHVDLAPAIARAQSSPACGSPPPPPIP